MQRSFLFSVLCVVGMVGDSWGYGTWSLEQRLAVRYGAAAKFDVMVVDEEGSAVSNACVTVGFGQSYNKRIGEVVSANTNDRGFAEISGRTTGDNLWIMVDKDGYYSYKTNFNYIAVATRHEVRFNRWQPYGESCVICLRDVRNPLVRQNVKDCKLYSHVAPEEDCWIGFDLLAGDWVAPHGKGAAADLVVSIRSDGLSAMNSKRIVMNVVFVGVDNGGYYEELRPHSEFGYSYEAEVENAFGERSLSFHRYRLKGGFYDEGNPLKERAMIARIRTKKDSEGKIVSCHYVRILGFGMARNFSEETEFSIDYRLNLTPNDPNLEIK